MCVRVYMWAHCLVKDLLARLSFHFVSALNEKIYLFPHMCVCIRIEKGFTFFFEFRFKINLFTNYSNEKIESQPFVSFFSYLHEYTVAIVGKLLVECFFLFHLNILRFISFLFVCWFQQKTR